MKKSIQLTAIAGGGGITCMLGSCPTLYKSDDGRIFVQGFIVNENVVNEIPAGESLVEISPKLVEEIARMKV